MRDIQVSRPVLIALVGAVLMGGFLLFRGGGEEDFPPPVTTATTGATGSATGPTGKAAKAAAKRAKKAAAAGATVAVGASGPSGATVVVGGGKETAKERERRIARERHEKLVAAAKEAGMPTPVYDALQKNKTVFIFFWESDARDDQRVNDSVKNLQKYRGSSLVVFREPISNKSKYDGIAEAAEITQTPGIIILYKDKADTAQGYIDSAALNAKVTRLTGNSGD